MAGKFHVEEKSNLLQSPKDFPPGDDLTPGDRERAQWEQTENTTEPLEQHAAKSKALERERDVLLKEVTCLKTTNLALCNITKECGEEKEHVAEQRDLLRGELEALRAQFEKANHLRAEERLRDFEREEALCKVICFLKDRADSFTPKLKALEAVIKGLISDTERLKVSCADINYPLKSESDETVAVTGPEEDVQDCPEQRDQDRSTEEELKREFEAMEVQNKALHDEVRQLKIRFERMAERYAAEKREKEVIQHVTREAKVDNTDVCKDPETKTKFCLDKGVPSETLKEESDEGSEVKEKKAHIKQTEDLTLCPEGKSLRFHDMFEKLAAEKAHSEAVRAEQFKEIQILNFHLKQLQESLVQQTFKANEKERFLALKLADSEEKMSWYQEGARPKINGRFNKGPQNVTAEEDLHLSECSESGQMKNKKRVGWVKVAQSINQWHRARK